MADTTKPTEPEKRDSEQTEPKESESVKPTEPTQPTESTLWTATQPTKPAVKPVQPTKPKGVTVMAAKNGKFDFSNCKKEVISDGETLYDVAQKYHVALQQLRYFNGVNKATLRVIKGQTIYIPNKPVHVPVGK